MKKFMKVPYYCLDRFIFFSELFATACDKLLIYQDAAIRILLLPLHYLEVYRLQMKTRI